MSALITLDSLTFRSPDGRTLFEDLTLAFGRERTGLVGRNGAGETTLLRLILGELEPTAGTVARLGRLAILRQTLTPFPGATLADLLAVTEPLRILARIDRGAGSDEDLAVADWTLPTRLDAVLAEAGLTGMDLDRPTVSLSGGQATRAGLAALTLSRPDMILLDEPSNTLDAEARASLIAFLRAWPGGALIVSHDRMVLSQVDRIVELSSLGARVYGGDFDAYAARKAEVAAAAERDRDGAEHALARIDRTVQAVRERKARKDSDGRRAGLRNDMPKIVRGARAERAEGTGGRLNRTAERRRETVARDLEEARARVERARFLAFDLPPSGLAPGKMALTFEAVTFAWPGRKPLVRNLSFRVAGPERLALLGPNGAGKSTAMALASGLLAPAAGRILVGAPAVMLDQRAALLWEDQTLVENFRRLNREASDNQARAALARFLFRNAAADKTVAALSGGERLRAALGCVLMAARPPQMILLDEPTNSLDLDSIAALEGALLGYDGALIVASHDEDFLRAIGVIRTLVLGPDAVAFGFGSEA